MMRLGLALLLAVLVAGPASAAGRTVTFKTDDGVTLTATWYEPSARVAPAVIFVHMLHRTRHDWEAVATRFAAEGIGALALDLRGHGDSGGPAVEGETPDYSVMLKDVGAARRFLATRGEVLQGQIGIAGASLGANLATLYASTDPAIASLALLSPSLDYRGLRIESAAKKIARPMLLVASDDDPYAMRSAKDLEKGAGGPRELRTVSNAGHGTTMLGRDENLVQVLVDWFRRTLISS